MRQLRALLMRVRATLRWRDDEFAAEIDSHLQLHIDDNIRAGMTADEARRQALLRLGGRAQTQESYRDVQRIGWLDALRQDLVYASRALRKNRSFAATAILTLALGIGANSAIFSLVNAVLLRPLPFKDPNRLVMVFAIDPRGNRFDNPTYPDYVDWRSQNRAFESMAAFANQSVALAVGDQTVLIQGKRITPNLFNVLGVQPALGRGFHEDEERPGAGVVILSDGFWKRYFGAAADVLGQVVRINDASHTVIGVMPPSFHIDRRDTEQFYVPLPVDSNRGHGFLHVVGRLRVDATVALATAEMSAIADRLARLYPRTNAGVGTNLAPMTEALARDIRLGLYAMLVVVGIVLLIACANVAGLMLARGATRQRELAVRAALGAGRSRLVRQLLTESLLIALAGGGLGLVGADWISRALGGVIAEHFHNPRIDGATTDSSVLMFTLAVSIATGVAFGVFPAVAATSPDLNEALRDAGRAATGARAPRLRRSLVVVQLALALALLAIGGMLMNTLLTMRATHPGFVTRNMMVVDLWLPPTRFATLQDRTRFFADGLARIRALPGVTGAAFVADLPLNGGNDTESFHIVGRPDPSPARPFNAGFNIASAGYFHLMGTPILAGRDFAETDGPGTPGVAIVNETAARRFWPGQSPLGRQISLPITRERSMLLSVVGLAADVRHVGLAVPPRPEIFIHSMQSELNWPWLVLAVRAASSPAALADQVRLTLRQADPNVPITRINSADDVVARSIEQPQLYTLLLGTFAIVAAGLAAIGLYGLVAYSVSQRSHEIGVRVALGASRADILRLVLAQGATLAATGSVVGVAAGAAGTRALVGLFRGLQPNNPLMFAAVTGLLLAVALVATYLPARRAAAVDPVVALRAE
jgi:putative ABC transport system permease protein